MRSIRLLLAVFLVFLSARSFGDDDRPYVLLPAGQIKEISHLCSRLGPEKIEGSWLPDEAILKQAEADLGQLHFYEPYPQNPKKYYRQYIAVVIGGKKMLYLNASIIRPSQTVMISVCDGGPSFWGALYDPATRKYSELHFNGRA
jgi:hypothetical protein